MDKIKKRISQLRALMRERNIDAYLVPTSDYHESEYVGEHFASRKYITGFTGSAGTALITRDWAGLWTDGRYYLQASSELKGSGIVLMKSGLPGVPTVEEFIEQDLPRYGTLGFDGRVISAKMGESLAKRLEPKQISFACTESLIGEIWEDRPKISAEPIWVLDDQYAGKSAIDKIADLRRDMEREHATVHILTTLDDIAWLLNIRGNDIPYNPVALSYLAVTEENIYLFISPKAVPDHVGQYLHRLGVALRPYQGIYSYGQQLYNEIILLEKAKVNYAITSSLDRSNTILDHVNPTVTRKAHKNPTEVENLRKAHITDGVVMTRFIYWLKHQIGKEPITEYSAAMRLDEMRRAAGALDISFTTISAYGPNAAMCHYHAKPEDCATLEPRGLYLVDSGGQYLEGTTDVTRTIALGPMTDEEKEHYTLVLMGMLRLGHAKFLRGCTGLSLDYLAREPLWSRGLDFSHGTGHGVGYLLNVHERPVNIRYKVTEDRPDAVPFAPGMVCSDEPGLYIEGSHGIRTENLIVCIEGKHSGFGQFLQFEFLTCVPIDLEPIRTELMEERDILALNSYHEKVYQTISPYLPKEEREWLREVTLPVN